MPVGTFSAFGRGSPVRPGLSEADQVGRRIGVELQDARECVEDVHRLADARVLPRASAR
ncbi:hypothetical protein [Streptomyces sp. R41]|uniref:Uncharacterized protein n=1 Tax=Streptomyces sp. R41 TaxID=3238632 RepID=A0AB39R7D9_9ACTN